MTEINKTRLSLGLAFILAAAAAVLAEVDVVRLSSTGSGESAWIAAILVLSASAALVAMSDGRTIVLHRASIWMLVLLLAWLLVSALFSGQATIAVAAVLAYGALGVVAVRTVDAFGWEPLAVMSVVVFAVFVFVSLVIEVASDPELVVGGRLFLVSLDANQLARLAGFALVSGVCLAATRRPAAVAAAVLVIPVAIGVLGFAQSRTGGAAVLVSVAILIWHWVDRRLAIGVTLLAVLGLGIAAPLLLDTSVQELVTRDGEVASLGTFRGRSTTWIVAIEQVRADPMLGVGPTVDDEFFADARQSGRIGWRARNAHSLWGHLIVVGGLPALLLFVAAIAAFFFGARGPDMAFRTAMIGLMLVDGFSEAVFWQPGLATFLLAGVLASHSTIALPAAVDPLVEVRSLGADGGRIAVPG